MCICILVCLYMSYLNILLNIYLIHKRSLIVYFMCMELMYVTSLEVISHLRLQNRANE